MDRLDRYVLKAVLTAYLATVLFLGVMFVGLDLVLRMEKFLASARSAGLGTFEMLREVMRFELLSVPFMFVRIAPFVTVIASVFALTRLMRNNEIVPMLFAGRSVLRVLRTMIGVSVLSALAMAVTWEWVLPPIRGDLVNARTFARGRQTGEVLGNVAIRSPEEPDGEIFCQVYLAKPKRMEGVVYYRRRPGDEEGDYIGAAAAVWDEGAGDWRLVKGRRVTQNGLRVEDLRFLGARGITPTLIVQSEMERRDTMMLGYSELTELLHLRGGRADYRLAFHQHITFPMSNVLLLLLVLPFALRYESGRRTVHVSIAILACGSYLLLDLTCQNLVYRGAVHPLFGAWTPTIVYGSLAGVLVSGVRS